MLVQALRLANERASRIIISILFAILLVFMVLALPNTAAAAAIAACQVDGIGAEGVWVDLDGCVARIARSGSAAADGYVHGRWQQIEIRVDSAGSASMRQTDVAPWQFSADRDQDGDGIADSVDSCPTVRETFNNLYDDDGCPDNIHNLITHVANDLNLYWRAMFQQNGLAYSAPRVVKGYWGSSAREYNAFFNPRTHSIHYDLNLLNDTLLIGDFAPLYVISHEWGHLVQSNLALLDNRFNIHIELQADCFAGLYTRHLEQNGQLGAGDLDESLQIAYFAGDADNVPWFAGHAHGSGLQRVSAFYNGYDGTLDTCIDGY